MINTKKMIIKESEFINNLTLLIQSNSDEQDESYILSPENIEYISKQMYQWYIDGGDKPKFEAGDMVSFTNEQFGQHFAGKYFYIIGNAHRDKEIWKLTTKKGSTIPEEIAFSHQLTLRKNKN